MNHWVSGKGPFDRCAACGHPVPNAWGSGPCIITGECKGARTGSLLDRMVNAPASPDVFTSADLAPVDVLFVCRGCLARPPYFGQDAGALGAIVSGYGLSRPGWCMRCRAWMGDDFAVVPRTPAVVDLVAALLGAAGLR